MIYSLDLETRSLDPRMSEHAALEPWRVRQKKAEIASLHLCRPDNTTVMLVNNGQSTWRNEVVELLESLDGCVVYAHFTVFDLAFLIGTVEPNKYRQVPDCISRIKWRDTSLLVKWLINGQKPEKSHFSYSLVNIASVFLKDHPQLPAFIEMKSQTVAAGEDDEYWEARGDLDVIMTKAIADKLQPMVPEEMRTGLLTEFACLVPVANSWMNGIKIDVDQIEEVESNLLKKMDDVVKKLGVEGTVLSSPKQLGNLLFNEWGIKPLSYTKTGPCTAKSDLMWIHYGLLTNDPDSIEAKKMSLAMEFKKNATLLSKYVKTLKQALEHTGDGCIYGRPRLFGTYTGRMTYSSETKKGRFKCGIALHQIPRKAKEIRALLIAPPGMGILEDDASGQESRLMAIRSGDQTMIRVFKEGWNFHSMTGSGIIGMDYHEFQELYKKQEAEEGGGYYVEQRQLGKLTNLSCNYRIGGKSLSEKALVNYDTFLTEETGRFLVNTFKRQYPGVPAYWNDVIRFARSMGYTEAFGGRRYKICDWAGRDAWGSESSAINFPIQGGGASMKEIAIAILFKKFPEAPFALDLHDATFMYGPLDQLKELEAEILDALNAIDYEPYWGFKPVVPLTYESASGLSFRDVK